MEQHLLHLDVSYLLSLVKIDDFSIQNSVARGFPISKCYDFSPGESEVFPRREPTAAAECWGIPLHCLE